MDNRNNAGIFKSKDRLFKSMNMINLLNKKKKKEKWSKLESKLVVNHLMGLFPTKAYQLKWYLKCFSGTTPNQDKILNYVIIQYHCDNLNINEDLILCMKPCLRHQFSSGAAFPIQIAQHHLFENILLVSSILMTSWTVLRNPAEAVSFDWVPVPNEPDKWDTLH